MRQVLAIAVGAILAGLGAVVLGEYVLMGPTAVVGFPLYGIAVSEATLAVGKRLSLITLVAGAVTVAAGLTWALWISFGHFRNGASPPVLSWVMVVVAAGATFGWGWSGRKRGTPPLDLQTEPAP